MSRITTPFSKALALAALCALAQAPATAGEVRATAEWNTYGAAQDINNGALATAVHPDNTAEGYSLARATRLRVGAASGGGNSGHMGLFHHAAHAANFTQYTLWNLDTQQPIDLADALLLTVSFNFRAAGRLDVPSSQGPTDWDRGTTGYGAEVAPLSAVDTQSFSNGVTWVYGATTGDASLVEVPFEREFSLLHRNHNQGLLWMNFGNLAAEDVEAYGALALISVSLVEPPAQAFLGAAGVDAQTAAPRLGIRFDTGDVYAFGQALDDPAVVPVPATWALMLVAFGLLGCGRRSSSQAQASVPGVRSPSRL